jgi:hypothetical protein
MVFVRLKQELCRLADGASLDDAAVPPQLRWLPFETSATVSIWAPSRPVSSVEPHWAIVTTPAGCPDVVGSERQRERKNILGAVNGAAFCCERRRVPRSSVFLLRGGVPCREWRAESALRAAASTR